MKQMPHLPVLSDKTSREQYTGVFEHQQKASKVLIHQYFLLLLNHLQQGQKMKSPQHSGL